MSRTALCSLLLVVGWLIVLPPAVPQPGNAPPGPTDSGDLPDPYRARNVVIPSPYWGYSINPYASYLHGVADVTRANAQYQVIIQQAALAREQVRAVKLQRRRQELEHWAWEREFKLDVLERERERIHNMELNRSRKDPPASEILSASTLNLLLKELKALPDIPGESTPIDPESLSHIHVASPAGGNLGLLKKDQVFWPLMLRTHRFDNERAEVERRLRMARSQVETGQGVSADLILEMRQLQSRLQQRTDNAIRGVNGEAEWSPSDAIRVERFLKELRATVQILEQPDIAFYLKKLEGKTVAEVVAHMRQNGVLFRRPRSAMNATTSPSTEPWPTN